MEPVVIGEIVAGSCCYFLVECKYSSDVYNLMLVVLLVLCVNTITQLRKTSGAWLSISGLENGPDRTHL